MEVTAATAAGEDRLAPTYRVRLLSLEGGVLVERPQSADAARYLRDGTVLRVLAAEKDDRWEFVAAVAGQELHALNRATKVPAVRLSPTGAARSAQRRSFFRVSAAGVPLKPVWLRPMEGVKPAPSPAELEANPGQLAAEPLAAPLYLHEPFPTTLLNVGGGGIGVEAPLRVAQQLPRILSYSARLELPTLPRAIDVATKLVHLQPRDDGTHYMGLAFEFADPAAKRRDVDLLCKFTTWLQRQQLQRRK